MKEIIDFISAFLVLFGSIFFFIASIGIVKMPDIFIRMSATTKAASLGVGSILLGTSLFFLDASITARAFIIIVFVFLTAPIAAHAIGRAAYKEGVKLWDKSVVNELGGKYKDNTLK